MHEPHGTEDAGRSTRMRRVLLTALVAVVGIGAGVGATIALTGDDGDGADTETEAAEPSDLPTSPEEVQDRIDAAAEAGPGAPAATDPEAAVTGFLAAEEAGDLETSYTFLSTADRAEFGSAAGWVAAHAELLPPVLGHGIESVDATETSGEVATLVQFRPSLDEVVGLIPGEARARWSVVVDDDGLWGVALDESVVEPLYPSDDGVVPATEAWVAARADCVEDPPQQRSPLLGVIGPADALCDSPLPAVGAPEALADVDAAPFLTAFGGSATTWARVVDVDGPVPLRAVLAPIGEDWIVIGVLPA